MNFIAGLNAVASIFQPFAAFGFTLAMHPMQRELSVDTIVNAQKEKKKKSKKERKEAQVSPNAPIAELNRTQVKKNLNAIIAKNGSQAVNAKALRKALKKRKVKKGVAGDFSYTTTPVEFYGGSEELEKQVLAYEEYELQMAAQEWIKRDLAIQKARERKEAQEKAQEIEKCQVKKYRDFGSIEWAKIQVDGRQLTPELIDLIETNYHLLLQQDENPLLEPFGYLAFNGFVHQIKSMILSQ